MKPLTISLIGIFGGLCVCTPHMLCALVESEDQEKEAIREWRDVIEAGCGFKTYGVALRKFSRPWTYCDAERLELYEVTQRKAVSLPGHAEYFAELIEKERAALKPGDFRSGYDRNRFLFLRDTLRHLPSPETVKVLGRYLDDDRDIPPPPKPSDDFGQMPTTSLIAMESLLLLEIRDAPYPPGRYYPYPSTKELSTVRSWFAPIKSGEKPFSFKGQAVEYRFQPDGTWTTTPIANRPEDAPKPPEVKVPAPAPKPVPPPPPKGPDAATSGRESPVWPWIAGALLALLAGLGWIFRSRKKSGP